jgi:hypothetical protein
MCINALPCKMYLQTTPPCRGGLWRCHVSRDLGPHLLVEVSSGAVCPSELVKTRVICTRLLFFSCVQSSGHFNQRLDGPIHSFLSC